MHSVGSSGMRSQVVLMVITMELSDSTVLMLPILTENSLQHFFGLDMSAIYTLLSSQVATTSRKEIGYLTVSSTEGPLSNV
jgi:uncharacterized membrane protein